MAETAIDHSLDSFFGRGMRGDFKLLLVMVIVSVLIRSGIGLSPFSGKFNSDPQNGGAPWGDFECHRTWFTVTNNLPVGLWYANTPLSNTEYWPLDYPPLCAYFHNTFSYLLQVFTPFAISLDAKQGENDPQFVASMRLIVILGEIYIFAPGLYFFVKTNFKYQQKTLLVIWFALFNLTPALFVDHGHY